MVAVCNMAMRVKGYMWTCSWEHRRIRAMEPSLIPHASQHKKKSRRSLQPSLEFCDLIYKQVHIIYAKKNCLKSYR